MAATGVYTYSSPPVGSEFIAPSSYWVIPNGGTSISCQVSAFNGSGSPVTVPNFTCYVRNISDGNNANSFNGGTSNSVGVSGGSGVTNGVKVFTVGASIGGSCNHITMQVTSYTGKIYSQISVRRSGAWNAVPVYVRRSGTWRQCAVFVRRSGAWSQIG